MWSWRPTSWPAWQPRKAFPLLALAPEALSVLHRQRWPGSVRELDVVLYASMTAALGDDAQVIELQHLPEHLRATCRGAERRQLDPAAIEAALAASEGVVARAARRLGVHGRTLYRRMRAVGLRRAGGAGSPPGGAA